MRKKDFLTIVLALLAPCVALSQARPKPPLTVCIDSDKCVATSEPTAGIKWHPGHYMDTDTVERPGYDSKNVSMSTLTSIANTPFKGVLAHYSWALLEPTRGNYDFSRIRQHRDALKAIGKQLIIYVQDRTYVGDGPPPAYIMPSYLLSSPEFEGGWVPRGNNTGTIPKLWLASVMDREVALMKALGAEFDGDPQVEMVSWEETALYNVIPPGYSQAAMTQQFHKLADGMSSAFPSTTACILTNFYHDQSSLRDLIDYFISKRLCVGGPDVRPDNKIAGSLILSGQYDGVDRRSKTAIVFHNEWRSLGGEWTLEKLQDYAFNTNGQHYTTWARKEAGAGLTFSSDVRPWLTSKLPPTRVSCPANYNDACVTN